MNYCIIYITFVLENVFLFLCIIAADTWGSGSVWPSANTSSSNLWTPLDGGTERGTPSSLNSFLPENLLGSELN